MKRPRLVYPIPKPWMEAQRSLQSSPVFQLNGSLRNTVQGREIQENQDFMDVEDQEEENHGNQLVDVPNVVVQLD